MTAYHVLPIRWSEPIVEQIFLPAHAATSGVTLHDPCVVTTSSQEDDATIVLIITGYVTPATGGLTVNISVSATGPGAPASPVTATTRLQPMALSAEL